MAVHIPSELEQKLRLLAAKTERTPDELLHEAVVNYIWRVESLSAAIHEDEESANKEGWLPHDEVFGSLKKRLAKTDWP